MNTTVLQQEVKDLMLHYLEQKQVSQNKLAEMMEVSSATVSNVLNGQWERIKESMLLKIKSFFKPKTWTVIGTTNFINIQEQCNKARNRKMMIGIIGYTGAGKTTALHSYYENSVNTYMVVCARSMRTKQFLAEILKSLGIQYSASDYEMVRMIIEVLNKKEAPLLIIDEASKLSPNAFMYLQDIWDGVEDNAGIILAGVEYLLSNLEKVALRNKIGMPEFYGRVASWFQLVRPTKNEIKSICEHNGITDHSIIKEMYPLNNFRHVRNGILNHINP